MTKRSKGASRPFVGTNVPDQLVLRKHSGVSLPGTWVLDKNAIPTYVQAMLTLLLVEDNPSLRTALKSGLEATGKIQVIHHCASGEEAVTFCLEQIPNATLLDVQLAGAMNGIQTAMALRREWPRLPVVFYSIQDDDAYYRDFLKSGILSHYAYVRKSNYLLPQMIVPLLQDALAGRSFIDPDIAARVQAVQQRDAHHPMTLLEPNERVVANLIAQGLTNEQIAVRLGFRDKRTISRINGQIYTAWGLDATNSDEKTARTRAAIIVRAERLIHWDEAGMAWVQDVNEKWVEWKIA